MASEQEQLACLVQQWNENRLDLFHLSYPTEDLEIEGVMRFYFQDGGERVLTKCVRVSSTATTRAVIDALSEKFLPDLKMLTNDTYSLWEVHENGDERRLEDEEKPLLVQLTWHRDDREGRFLLRRDQVPPLPLSTIQLQEAESRTKRFAKKKEKEVKKKHQKDIVTVNSGREEPVNSNDIYKQVPFNTFTRTISNPEAVMRKRREKKLENKLKEMVYGGSIKVFGGDIVPSRPYVTMLAGLHDRAEKILSEALEKYGLENRDDDFVLVEMSTSSDPGASNDDGRIVGPDECPLIQMTARAEDGFATYLAIKPRPSDYQIPSTMLRSSNTITSSICSISSDMTPVNPVLLIVLPDGSVSSHHVQIIDGVTEIGKDHQLSEYSAHNIYLDGPDIRNRHATITFMDGVATITPCSPDAYLEVNGSVAMQTEVLRDGDVVRIGADNLFRYSCAGMATGSAIAQGPNGNRFAKSIDSRGQPARIASEYGNLPMNESFQQSVEGSSQASSRKNSEQINGAQNGHLSNGQPRVQLPILIQIGDYKVWDFLEEVISRGWPDSGSFRLAPAYALYLAVRFFHSSSKAYLGQFFARIEAKLRQLAATCGSRDELLFWLANASELNYLVERDAELSAAPRKLSAEIERIFRGLCAVLVTSLRTASLPLLDMELGDEAATAELLNLLDGTLRAARACRLNAALTIQIAGHMMHTVNAFLFNNLVGAGFKSLKLTARLGAALQARIAAIHEWAEGMGVELAAECHLDRSRQAANLLAAPKNDVAALGATCYKLNSLQVMQLLSRFEPEAPGEPLADDDVIDRIVRLAEKQADQLTRDDGLRVTVEEVEELNLPFFIPQDEYFADMLGEVPDGFTQYLLQLQDRRLCHSVTVLDTQQQPTTTATQQQQQQQQQRNQGEEIIHPITVRPVLNTFTPSEEGHYGDPRDQSIRVTLKRNGGGIGLSIIGAQGIGDRQSGIYVKKIMDGTPAALDGRLESGDQLLSVNGRSLLGITQEEAARMMTGSGNEVHFEVKKGAAYRNGLSSWIMTNTPTTPSSINSQNGQRSVPVNGFGGSVQSVNVQNQPPPSYQHRYQQNGGPQPSVQVPTVTIPKVAEDHFKQHYEHHQMSQRNGGPRVLNSSMTATPSAFVEPLPQRHYRSNSASDLQEQSSQRSSQVSVERTSNFDKLPAHYRHSARPTVIQPGRPSRAGAQSPSALRRGAASPTPLGSASNLYRPSSASNLFAPPRSPNPLQGYTRSATRDSNPDLFQAAASSTPVGHSSPTDQTDLPMAKRAVRPSSMYDYTIRQDSLPPQPSVISPPRVKVNGNNSMYQEKERIQREPAVALPDLRDPQIHQMHHVHTEKVHTTREHQQHQAPPPQTVFGNSIRGGVPTAITQALQGSNGVPRPRPTTFGREERNGLGAEIRQLERTNTALLNFDTLNDELEHLEQKGSTLTHDEANRYRELVNAAAEQSRTRRILSNGTFKPMTPTTPTTTTFAATTTTPTKPMRERRVETVIDDVGTSYGAVHNNGNGFSEYRPSTLIDGRNEQLFPGMSRHSQESEYINSPAVVGAHEIYRDPRQRRLNELQEREAVNTGRNGESLGFRDKQRLFAKQIGEDGTPKQRLAASSAQRQIEYDR